MQAAQAVVVAATPGQIFNLGIKRPSGLFSRFGFKL